MSTEIIKYMNFQFRFTKAKQHGILDLTNIYIARTEEKSVTYLNSICNMKIWNLSQKIHHDGLVFENKLLLTAIFKAISCRSAMENSNRVIQCQKVENIDRLLAVAKRTFFPPRGIG